MILTREMKEHASKQFQKVDKLHKFSQWGLEEGTVVCPNCETKNAIMDLEFAKQCSIPVKDSVTIDTDIFIFKNRAGGKCYVCNKTYTPEECWMLVEVGLVKDWVLMARKYPDRVFVINGTFFKINKDPDQKRYENNSQNITIKLNNGNTIKTKSCYLDSQRFDPMLKTVIPDTAIFIKKPNKNYWKTRWEYSKWLIMNIRCLKKWHKSRSKKPTTA